MKSVAEAYKDFPILQRTHNGHPLVYLDSGATTQVPNAVIDALEKHLKKFECFCFTKQVLKANETRQMPVQFVIEPGLPADVDTVTISYTFFELPDGGSTAKK